MKLIPQKENLFLMITLLFGAGMEVHPVTIFIPLLTNSLQPDNIAAHNCQWNNYSTQYCFTMVYLSMWLHPTITDDDFTTADSWALMVRPINSKTLSQYIKMLTYCDINAWINRQWQSISLKNFIKVVSNHTSITLISSKNVYTK